MTWRAISARPYLLFNLGCSLDLGEGVAAPDHPAAADWFRRAADAGHGVAAMNLSHMYVAGRAYTRPLFVGQG